MNGNDIIERLFNNIIESKEIFKAPSIYSKEDFESYLNLRIDNYYEFLKINDFSQSLNELYKLDSKIESNKDELKLLNRIKGFNDVLKRGIRNYFNGKPNKFYESFSSSLDKLLNFRINTFISEISPGTKYYRIRRSHDSLESIDLFHIPFELRYLCSTQRYSIPGVPSIYLGSSTEICLFELEINNTNIDECYISLFKSNMNINVLEILTVQSFITKMKEANSSSAKYNLLLKFVMLFPLYLASTIKVKVNNGFKPEYIVPQFLLEYISSIEDSEKKIDGIKFPSTKTNSLNSGHNLVLPIVQSNISGHCSHLKEMLQLSKPLFSKDISSIKNIGNIKDIDFIKLDGEIALENTAILT